MIEDIIQIGVKMKFKNKRGLNLNILLAILTLLSLLLVSVSGVNAWFTSGYRDVLYIVTQVSDDKLTLYQKTKNGTNDVYTPLNTNALTIVDSRDKILLPDSAYDLNVELRNENDSASAELYIRFSFQVLVQTSEVINGQVVAKEISLKHNLTYNNTSFKKVVNNGDIYYYYQQNNANALFSGNSKVTLFTKFSIPESEFLTNGEARFDGGENFKLLITVEGSSTSNF